MAESIAAEVLKPVIEATVKSVGATIKRQFNYLCCFTSNIATLKDEAERLDDATKGLQGRVDREIDNVQVIVPEVETWIKRSNHIKDEMNGILNEVPNVESGCLKLSARFSLSKRAKKTADRMEELRGQCKFEAIAQPGPPPATQTVLLGTTYEFESRKQIEDGIMKSLRDGEMNMIGICGMGGLGKTTMAKRLMNRALEEHLFEEVVMAVVSKQVDKLKIQEDIAGSLGLKLEGETFQVRVQKLHARLSGTKRILLVLDDVWEKLELEDLGIPCGSKGCTILLTTRNSDALHAMNVQKVTGMEILSEEEAWFLFRERSGTCVDDTKLNSIAKEVVKECKGLPIALTTLGATLKDEKNKGIWKDAVRQLKKASPTNIPDFIKEVYNPLKVSYDKLDSEEAKSVFLLCCLFGEDANIPLDYLTYFCMGLSIFEGGMEEAWNSMCTLIKMLKSRSLLLDGFNEDFVRMHDVIRDVCMFIAKDEGYIGSNDCTWFSSFQTYGRSKLPTNLRLLFLSHNSDIEQEFKIDSTFLEGIRDLYVMFIEQNYSLTSLPRTTCSFKNLNTLILSSCRELETLSGIGELVNLEILICGNCPWIKELPLEIKGLHRLKVLDFTRCRRLQRIGRGIISSLVGLEEFKMLYSFKKWEASDSSTEIENAELRELEALTNLTCLEIEIDDPVLAAEKMHLSSKLERFSVFLIPEDHFSDSSGKKLSLNWEEGTCLGHWIEMQLLPETYWLYLSGNGANNLDLAKVQNISSLMLGKCKSMKNIVRTMNDDGHAFVFPSIYRLELFSLPDLQEIWDGPISSNSFQNLKQLVLRDLPALKKLWKNSSSPVFPKLEEVELLELPNLATFELPLELIPSIQIRRCARLRNLGQFSVRRNDCLSKMEVLEIEECEMMEQVFLWNEEEDQNKNNRRQITKVFPKLKKVTLKKLPNLVTFSEGIEGIEFPLLTKMQIEECPKMISMVSSNVNNSEGTTNADIDDHHYSHLFCQPQKMSFGKLEKLVTSRNPFCGHKVDLSCFNGLQHLTISKCEGGMSLFSFTIARNLVTLRELYIFECDEIVQVIKDEEDKAVSAGERNRLFPNLQSLLLGDLRKLVSFCEWNCDVELPSLRSVGITGCPNIKNFSFAPNLEHFLTDLNNYREDGVKVPFDSLKQLEIRRNENPLYCYKIPVSLFRGLETLEIAEYQCSMSLFSFSIAGNLVNIKDLRIWSCDEMVQVIQDEEEKAVSGDGLLFPKLQFLSLYGLPKLVSFCEWKYDVELPSLKQLQIHHCHNMKYFTLGSLTTPNLKTTYIIERYFGVANDLNVVLQKQYLAREKENQENEKKSIAEDQENKAEIEEEQNS